MKAYIEALRHPRFEQGRLELWDPTTGKVCALGLYLRQVKGMSYRECRWTGYDVADEELGEVLSHQIEHWNDGKGLTFAEIADKLTQL